MGVIAEAGRNVEAAPGTRVHVVSAAIVRALRPDPLLSVRASGDAGHDDGCAYDHLIPGVCAPAGEEASDG